jgi:hypothetical protein
LYLLGYNAMWWKSTNISGGTGLRSTPSCACYLLHDGFLLGLLSVVWDHATGDMIRMGVYKTLMQLLTCITGLQSIHCSPILWVFTSIPTTGIYDNMFLRSQVNCCWLLPAQSFLVPSSLGLMTILYCLTILGVLQ